jgi:hypothetical protein
MKYRSVSFENLPDVGGSAHGQLMIQVEELVNTFVIANFSLRCTPPGLFLYLSK